MIVQYAAGAEVKETVRVEEKRGGVPEVAEMVELYDWFPGTTLPCALGKTSVGRGRRSLETMSGIVTVITGLRCSDRVRHHANVHTARCHNILQFSNCCHPKCI